MRKIVTSAIALSSILAFGAPALADDHEDRKAEVVERDEAGHATKVKVGEQVYAVCTADMMDGCINPRAAGLDFGSTPLDHWPGAPASELTPAEKMKTAEENAAAKAEAEAEAAVAEVEGAETP